MLIYYGIDCNIACFQNAIMKCFVENNLFTICQIFKKKVTYMGLVMMWRMGNARNSKMIVKAAWGP